jgi:hypothetical protein
MWSEFTKRRGIVAERLFGEKEMFLYDTLSKDTA